MLALKSVSLQIIEFVLVIAAVGLGFTFTVNIFVDETVSQAKPLSVEIANLLY